MCSYDKSLQYVPAEVLTKEAVDYAEKAAHGADDGRDNVIFSGCFQTAGVDLSHAGPLHFEAHLSGISHSGWTLKAPGPAEVQSEVGTSAPFISSPSVPSQKL